MGIIRGMRPTALISVFVLELPPGWSPAQDRATPPAWLEGEDATRYRSMPSPRRRAEFAAGRLLLGHALAAFAPHLRWRLHAPPGQALRIEALDNGVGAPSASLAHSAGLVACAVSGPRRLGIDLERRGARRRSLEGLAQAVLHPQERAQMARLAPGERTAFLLRCWTLKEALAKALGQGLALPFDEFAFESERLAAAPAYWSGARQRWRFAHPVAGDDATLGLAWSTAGESEEVSLSVEALPPQRLAALVAR